jgi:hypothetical protein
MPVLSADHFSGNKLGHLPVRARKKYSEIYLSEKPNDITDGKGSEITSAGFLQQGGWR